MNEIYFDGYFYIPTNTDDFETAKNILMSKLESIGVNYDNINKIELRDKDGNVVSNSYPNKIN